MGPPTTGTGLQKGLLVYLPFNGSIADSSGNNNPTEIVGSGAGLTYDVHGYANSAYGSDGTYGRLEGTAASAQTCSDYGDADDHHRTDTSGFIPQAESWYNITATFRRARLASWHNTTSPRPIASGK